MVNWSQLSIGAILGGVGTLALQAARTLLDHILDERKQNAAEQRVIRTEQREEARKESERKRADAAKLKQDADTVEMFKTQVKGATDLAVAANFVGIIHQFFVNNPQYVSIPENRRFLEKYAQNFHDLICYDTARVTSASLAVLQNDVHTLKIQ
jgi:chlorite dismutase